MSKQWKVVVAVAVGAAACGFLARWSGIVAPWPIAWIAMAAFAMPSFAAAVSWLGRKDGLGALAALSLFALSVETFGVATGWPYGAFSYASALGPKILGLVPPTVPFGWVPLVFAAWTLAPVRWRFPAALGLLIGFDLVFDPAAVALRFWHWEVPGPWFGVPWINFFGWIISGSIGLAMLGAFVRRRPVPERLRPWLVSGAAWTFAFAIGVWGAGISSPTRGAESSLVEGASRWPSGFSATFSTEMVDASVFLRPEDADSAWRAARATSLDGTPRILLVNHHALAADLMAAAFRSAAAKRPVVSRIVIVAPDHFRAGTGTISVSGLGYRTGDGPVAIDPAAEPFASALGTVLDRGEMFRREHGVGALVPFVAKAWPGASLVAVATRADVAEADLGRLSAALRGLDDGRTLFVVSADMSHGLPLGQAKGRDVETRAWIGRGDDDRLRQASDAHLDNGRGLAATLMAVGTGTRFQEIGRGDSSEYLPGHVRDVTTYLVGAWTEK